MVLPAIIGAIGAIGSGLIGANAQSEAAMYNYMVNMYNIRKQNQARQEAIRQAEKNKQETQLGFTDSKGNRVHFVEGKGWVEEKTGKSAQIDNLEDLERIAVLTEDLPMRRSANKRNDRRSRMEDVQARSLMDEFARTRKQDPNALSNQLIASLSQGINESYDKALGTQLRSASRTGITDTSKITAGINKERAGALAKAFAQARVQGMEMADSQFSKSRADIGNLYNMFAGRASALPQTSYMAQTGGDAGSMLSQFVNQLSGGNSAAVNTKGMPFGEMGYVEPQMGMANAFGQGASAIAGGLSNWFGGQAQGAAQQAWGPYGGMDTNSPGAYGYYDDDRQQTSIGGLY